MGFSIRGALVLACVVFVAARAAADPAASTELPLAEVVKVAVRQSPELERARIDVEAARAALLQAEGIEDFHIGATVTTEIVHAPPTDTFTNDLNDQTVSVSASRALPTGGTVSLIGSTSRSHDRVIQRSVVPREMQDMQDAQD